jgi:predicted flap endonuclease-1-like 5' DNA nuclease
MSTPPTPIQAAFELQRRSIEHGERLIEQSFAAQRDVMTATIQNGFAAQREAQAQALELGRRLLHAQADAMQATLNGDEFRSIADRQYEALAENQAIAMNEFESSVLDAVEELSQHQQTMFVEAFESAVDAQSDVEQQAVETANRTREIAGTARRQTQEVAETAQRGAQQAVAQTAETAQQGMTAAERQAQAVQRSTTAATEQMGASTQGTGAPQQTAPQQAAAPQSGSGGAQQTGGSQKSGGSQEAAEPVLEEIDGLGPTYAERLEAEGIHSPTDLAAAEPATVADIAEAPEHQAGEWIEEARSWT